MWRSYALAAVLWAPLACGFDTAGATPADAAPAIDGDARDPELPFGFRRKLTIDHDGALSSVPILVVLDGERIDYSEMRADGADLEFRDAGGARLPHEVELWDPNGTSWIWVLADIVGGSDPHIWMYYGDQDTLVEERPHEVWIRYRAVYHLAGDDLTDSTASGFHGTDQGTAAVEQGRIGSARLFDGQSYIDLGADRPFAQGVAGVTASLWMRRDQNGEGRVLASSVDTSGGPSVTTSRVQIQVNSDGSLRGVARALDEGPGFELIVAGDIPAEEWSWVTFVIDFASGELLLYRDGEEIGASQREELANTTSPDSPSTATAIGAEDNGSSGHFRGQLDEVRLANEAFSADWISVQYRSMTDALLWFGDPEPLRASGVAQRSRW